MFFPEFLYQLSKRDQQVTWLDPVFIREDDAVASAGVNIDVYEVPLDRCLILQNLALRASPGGAQTVVRQIISAIPPTAGDTYYIVNDDEVVAGTNSLNWTGSIIIPPQWTIRAQGSFSAGVAANTVDCALIGILIPVGNLQRV